MKTRFFHRYLVCCCVYAAGLIGLLVYADNGGDVPQERKLTLGELCERIDRAIKVAETNENARKHPDVRNDIFLSATRRLIEMEKLGDRAALPFLEEKSLMANAPRTFRARAAIAYIKIADVEECAEFLPKILAIGNEEKSAGGWRNRVTPMCLAKIDAGIAKHELSDESVARFMTALLTFAQSTDNSWEAKNADDFLSKHCEGYPMSKQRVALWHAIVTTGNEWSKEKYAPLSQSLEAIPPSKRTDLRKRFPDLPPLPDDAPARSPVKVAIAVAVGFVALAVCAVAAWLAVRRRRVRETT